MKQICPYHKTELIVLNKYVLGCDQIIKKKNKQWKCPHVQFSPVELYK